MWLSQLSLSFCNGVIYLNLRWHVCCGALPKNSSAQDPQSGPVELLRQVMHSPVVILQEFMSLGSMLPEHSQVEQGWSGGWPKYPEAQVSHSGPSCPTRQWQVGLPSTTEHDELDRKRKMTSVVIDRQHLVLTLRKCSCDRGIVDIETLLHLLHHNSHQHSCHRVYQLYWGCNFVVEEEEEEGERGEEEVVAVGMWMILIRHWKKVVWLISHSTPLSCYHTSERYHCKDKGCMLNCHWGSGYYCRTGGEKWQLLNVSTRGSTSVLHLTRAARVLWWAFTHFYYTVCNVFILPTMQGSLGAVTRNASIGGTEVAISTFITFYSSITLLHDVGKLFMYK